MIFSNFEDFKTAVGLIDSPDLLAYHGAPKPVHHYGMYETTLSQRDALNKFLRTHPEFHIATVVDDGENMLTIENRLCLVNRIGYYLCNGDRNQTLILEEPEDAYEAD